MAKNSHKVPKKLWKKFGIDGQGMFNRLWTELRYFDCCLPEGVKLTRKQASVLRWNICVLAAFTIKDWEGVSGFSVWYVMRLAECTKTSINKGVTANDIYKQPSLARG